MTGGPTRRQYLGLLVGTAGLLAGLGALSGDRPLKKGLPDLVVKNETEMEVTVTVRLKHVSSGSVALDETFTLAGGESRSFANPLTRDGRYLVSVHAPAIPTRRLVRPYDAGTEGDDPDHDGLVVGLTPERILLRKTDG